MLGQLKSKLEDSLEQLEELMDEVEDQFDELDDVGEVLWKKTKAHMYQLSKRLEKARDLANQALSVKSEEAELQLHLAAMDAQEQWQSIEAALGLFSQNRAREIHTEVDHAEVQLHLAKLDASDYVNEQAQRIRHEFNASRAALESKTLAAATTLQQRFSGAIGGLPK